MLTNTHTLGPCKDADCGNGVCASPDSDTRVCSCIAGWSGATCATNINKCAGQTCSNHGTCKDQVNGFKCKCVAGWSGATCATNINDCVGQTCSNHGTCKDAVNSFQCTCVAGWIGDTCQQATTTITATTATITTLVECGGVPTAGVTKVRRQSFGPPSDSGLLGNTSAMKDANWTFSYGTKVYRYCPGNPYLGHKTVCTPDHNDTCASAVDSPYVMVFKSSGDRGTISFTLPAGYCGFRLKVREESYGGADLVLLDGKALFGLPEGGCTANPVVVASWRTPGGRPRAPRPPREIPVAICPEKFGRHTFLM